MHTRIAMVLVLLVGLVLGASPAAATCILYDGSDVLTDEPSGAIVQETCSSTRATRTTLADLLSGEDQTNNLMQTSGGVVRTTTMASAITTDTTSAAVAIPTGSKTIAAVLTGTGAITQTLAIRGSVDNTYTAAVDPLICTLTLSGTTAVGDACPVITANFAYYFIVSSSTTGTSASGVVYAMY